MTIPEPWEPQPPVRRCTEPATYCPACQQPNLQCTCHQPATTPTDAKRDLCPIWDCQCPAGKQLRQAWIDMNRVLDQYGDSPQYRHAWGHVERLEAQRQATCHCPTL